MRSKLLLLSWIVGAAGCVSHAASVTTMLLGTATAPVLQDRTSMFDIGAVATAGSTSTDATAFDGGYGLRMRFVHKGLFEEASGVMVAHRLEAGTWDGDDTYLNSGTSLGYGVGGGRWLVGVTGGVDYGGYRTSAWLVPLRAHVLYVGKLQVNAQAWAGKRFGSLSDESPAVAGIANAIGASVDLGLSRAFGSRDNPTRRAGLAVGLFTQRMDGISTAGLSLQWQTSTAGAFVSSRQATEVVASRRAAEEAARRAEAQERAAREARSAPPATPPSPEAKAHEEAVAALREEIRAPLQDLSDEEAQSCALNYLVLAKLLKLAGDTKVGVRALYRFAAIGRERSLDASKIEEAAKAMAEYLDPNPIQTKRTDTIEDLTASCDDELGLPSIEDEPTAAASDDDDTDELLAAAAKLQQAAGDAAAEQARGIEAQRVRLRPALKTMSHGVLIACGGNYLAGSKREALSHPVRDVLLQRYQAIVAEAATEPDVLTMEEAAKKGAPLGQLDEDLKQCDAKIGWGASY